MNNKKQIINKLVPMLAAAVWCSIQASAAPVFQDTFETDLASGTETDVNYQQAGGRQSGGTTASTYTELVGSGAGGFLNVNATYNSDVLLLRNNYNSSGPRSSGVVLDTNFASSLEGAKYRISYTGLMSVGAGAATDRWMSINLGGLITDVDAFAPNAGQTDLGLLIRDNGKVTVWGDAGVIQNFTVAGTSGVANDLYTLDMLVDETLATPEVTVTFNGGTTNEVVLGTFAFNYEAGDAGLRQLGLRANIGTAGGTINGALFDSRYDDLTIEVIPEPATLSLIGAMGLGALFIRRRLMM